MKIIKARKKYPDIKSQRKYLSKVGGYSYRSSIAALIAIPIIISWGYIEYGNFNRKELAEKQLSEALATLEYAGNKVARYRLITGIWPNNRDEVLSKSDKFTHEYINDIYVNKHLIIVTFNKNKNILPEFYGKSLAYWGNDDNSTNEIDWACGSINIELSHLPERCKKKFK